MNNIVNKIIKGGIGVIPTDTVYGLVCDALNIDSVDKIYKLKKRDYNKPLVILVSNIEMLKKCIRNLNDLELDIINKYWPGELTIVFKKSNYIPDIVAGGTDEIAIRMPNNKELVDLINSVDRPLVATSANVSSQDTITNINKLEDSIKDNIDFIIDGGTINNSASTIIKVIDNKIKIYREGNLAKEILNTYKDIII
ncbi:MAG: threonylcarbamoyl-AMP synthase [Bacilli bacterium]|nr:threonylcarbamoyl-AMP synthase [Bacilli bacterium]